MDRQILIYIFEIQFFFLIPIKYSFLIFNPVKWKLLVQITIQTHYFEIICILERLELYYISKILYFKFKFLNRTDLFLVTVNSIWILWCVTWFLAVTILLYFLYQIQLFFTRLRQHAHPNQEHGSKTLVYKIYVYIHACTLDYCERKYALFLFYI